MEGIGHESPMGIVKRGYCDAIDVPIVNEMMQMILKILGEIIIKMTEHDYLSDKFISKLQISAFCPIVRAILVDATVAKFLMTILTGN